jgi:hypothetical protein
MPLWPSHNEKVMVKQIDFMCVLDWVFAQTRAVKRQQVRSVYPQGSVFQDESRRRA